MTDIEAETQAEGEAGSMHREPDAGLDPGTPGPRPGPRQAPSRCATQGSPTTAFLSPPVFSSRTLPLRACQECPPAPLPWKPRGIWGRPGARLTSKAKGQRGLPPPECPSGAQPRPRGGPGCLQGPQARGWSQPRDPRQQPGLAGPVGGQDLVRGLRPRPEGARLTAREQRPGPSPSPAHTKPHQTNVMVLGHLDLG